MKLYAVYWKGEEDRLETGLATWWVEFNLLGSLVDAAIFTKDEVEIVKAKGREYAVVVEIDV